MRTVILIALTMFLTGCDVIVDKPRVWHDDKRFVTCYMSPTMESIYCIQIINYHLLTSARLEQW